MIKYDNNNGTYVTRRDRREKGEKIYKRCKIKAISTNVW